MKRSFFTVLIILLMSTSLTGQEIFLKKGKYISKETGKPYTGVIRETDTSGRMISETNIREGLLEGNTFIYYPTGVKKESRSYHLGKKNGTWINWDENGRKVAEAGFKDGLKDGAWFVWDENETKRYEMSYCKGQKCGTWIIRNESGEIISREDFPK